MSKRNSGEAMTIVVAWTEDGVTAVDPDRGYDLGRRPELTIGKIGKSALWLNRGTAADVESARAFAKTTENGRVYTYPTTHKDPRKQSERAVVADIGKGA